MVLLAAGDRPFQGCTKMSLQDGVARDLIALIAGGAELVFLNFAGLMPARCDNTRSSVPDQTDSHGGVAMVGALLEGLPCADGGGDELYLLAHRQVVDADAQPLRHH